MPRNLKLANLGTQGHDCNSSRVTPICRPKLIARSAHYGTQCTTMSPVNPLHKQLDEQKFLHAVAYVEQAAGGPKILTTSELSYLNQMLTEKNQEPWRFDAAAVTIPTGETHHFNMLSNPIVSARDLIGETFQEAGNGDLLQAAFHLYSQMILGHFFRDANRRTAALATLWLVRSHKGQIDASDLEKFPVGDLRQPSDLERLKQKLSMLIR